MTERPNQSGDFTPPFPKTQLRLDTPIVCLVLARQLHFCFHRADNGHKLAQLALLGLDVERETLSAVNSPDVSATDLGLQWEHVADTGLATCLDTLYDYGVHGDFDLSIENGDLGSEGSASWCSRILHDLHRSAFAAEWNEYSQCLDAIERCLLICELAQARMQLNSHEESFMEWEHSLPGLTIRQMALLANMTEASLRTMTNPKRKFPLITRTDGRNTFVTPEDAKAWLRAKGRDVPIRHVIRGGEIDLATQRFPTPDALLAALSIRVQQKALEAGIDTFKRQAEKLDGVTFDSRGTALNVPDLGSLPEPSVLELATLLDLNGPLLWLRTQEAKATEALQRAGAEIQRLLNQKSEQQS